MIRPVVVLILWVVLLFGVVEARQNPPIVTAIVPVAATSDEATVTVQLTHGDTLTPQDFTPGPLANALKPSQLIVAVFRKIDVAGEPGKWTATLVVGNLIPFGESTVPLLVRGQTTHMLRFHKAGLVARGPVDGGFEIKEGAPLFVVLENPTTFAYSRVRARWRFNGTEVCDAVADASAAVGALAGDSTRCHDPAQWVTFGVARHAPVTLRVNAPHDWFLDANTGFPRTGRRSGVLTLQYLADDASAAVYEQLLPLDVQFSPGDGAIFSNLIRIAGWLTLGALLALVLRVVIPNYRRKEALKEQLNDAREAIGDISIEAALRVLLKVEILALDQLRQRSWVFGPSFQDLAQRIEQGIGAVRRKIEFTRRLDTARERQLALEKQDVPPTRLKLIDRQLNSACEVLLREQLTDQEWVLAQQRLEGADRLLGEPTKEERDAFDAFLAQRWNDVRDFFKDRLEPPDGLRGMADVLGAAKKLLAKENDADGNLWIQRVGPLRADLQISMLEVLLEFVFLASSAKGTAKEELLNLCEAPTPQGLEDARLILREVSEGIGVADVIAALERGEAAIEITPQSVRRNEKAHITLRFRDPKLDSAGARLRLRCEWLIGPPRAATNKAVEMSTDGKAAPSTEQATHAESDRTSGAAASSDGRSRRRWPWQSPDPYQTSEYGWKIFHCFGDHDIAWEVTARFYHNGKRVEIPVAPTTSTTDASAPATKHPDGSAPAVKGPDTAAPAVGNELLPSYPYRTMVRAQRRAQDWTNRIERIVPETVQLGAALLVPLATLAVTQADEGTSGRWWELIGVGFGSEMIRSVLSGKGDQSP